MSTPRKIPKDRPRHPATFRIEWRVPSTDWGDPGYWERSDASFTSLGEAEAALVHYLPKGHPRIVCEETGRWLDDFDAPCGRSYLTARAPTGQAVRSKYYSDEVQRAHALSIVRWALSDPALDNDLSGFDPRVQKAD